jgi:hypothetical protein
MKNKLLKVAGWVVAIALTVALALDLSARVIQFDQAERNIRQLKEQNELIERVTAVKEAQNLLLRENKMCLAFEANGPKRPLLLPEN